MEQTIHEFLEQKYQEKYAATSAGQNYPIPYPDYVLEAFEEYAKLIRNKVIDEVIENARIKQVYYNTKSTTYDDLETVNIYNPNGPDSYVAIDEQSILKLKS